MGLVCRDILTRFMPALSWTRLRFRTVPASFHVAMEMANYSWKPLCMPRTDTLQKERERQTKDELHSLLTYEKSLSIDYPFFVREKRKQLI